MVVLIHHCFTRGKHPHSLSWYSSPPISLQNNSPKQTHPLPPPEQMKQQLMERKRREQVHNGINVYVVNIHTMHNILECLSLY